MATSKKTRAKTKAKSKTAKKASPKAVGAKAKSSSSRPAPRGSKAEKAAVKGAPKAPAKHASDKDRERELHESLYSANVAAPRKLLASGVDPNARVDGCSVLHAIAIRIWNTRSGGKDSPKTAEYRKLADYALSLGAKLDFAAAAMLDKADFVKAALAKDPSLAKGKFKVNGASLANMAAWCGAKATHALLRGSKKPDRAPAGASGGGDDFAPWAERIMKLTSKELRRFAAKNRTPITKVAFDVNAAEGDILLAVDDTMSDDWAWSAFKHRELAALNEAEVLEPLVDRAREGDPELLLTSCAAALLCLRGMGHLDGLPIDDSFQVFMKDHDETDAAARARLKKVAGLLERV